MQSSVPMTRIERKIRRTIALRAPEASPETIERLVPTLVKTKKRDDLRARSSHAFQRDSFRAHMARFHVHPGAAKDCDGGCQW